jgi:hypothetical protein
MSSAFEKIFLTCVLVGSAVVLFGAGAVVGNYQARSTLQIEAAKHCGAGFEKITGEFVWIDCPTPVDTVIDTEVADEPVDLVPETAAPETVPPVATETPSEPVH